MVPLDATASGEGKIGFTLRVPIGVVGAISPFNFPLNLVAHKLAPAIAAGCPVVLKPASQTPFSGIALAELLIDDCGLPAEWLHVVTGGGSTVGNALVDHDDIALITFTGSPDVGWSIRGRAPRKKVGLELGNNAPVIIEADSDWQSAATKIRIAGFSHAGQSCISTQRILVHARHRRRLHRGPRQGGLLARRRRSDGRVDRRLGADLARRARPGEGVGRRGRRRRVPPSPTAASSTTHGVLVPTVLTDATPDMKVCSQEVFGPVVAIAAYDDLDEALRLANDTRYGLQAAIFTATSATRSRPCRRSTSAASSSTRCRRGAPTSSPTAGSATAATRVRARRTRCAR